MRKRTLKANSTPVLTVQAAFEQFQRQNAIKNLSPGTIEFYSSKSRRFFTRKKSELQYASYRALQHSDIKMQQNHLIVCQSEV